MLDKAVKKLLESGDITPHDLQIALEEQLRTNQSITKILLNKGLTTEAKLKDALESYDLEDINIREIYIHPNVIKMIPEHIIKNNKVFPLKFENNSLILAMVDPKDLITKDSVNIFLGRSTSFQSCSITKDDHDFLVNKFLNNFRERVENQEIQINQKEADPYSDASIHSLINRMFEGAIKRKATQISIEAGIENVKIRFKIDNSFYEEGQLPKKFYSNFLTQLKEMTSIDTNKKHNYSGNFKFVDSEKREFNIVLDSLNSITGEKLIIRIGSKIPELKKLLYSDHVYDEIKKVIDKNKGLVFVVGESGSGKTTTLYSMLQSRISNRYQIMTIEENIQYIFDNYVTQVKIDKNIPIKEIIYEALRHNPNVLMFEETKDDCWATLIEDLALSGMLVLTSFRAYNVISAIKRLKTMNFPNFSSINAIINQKLVKRLCNHCKIKINLNETQKNSFYLTDKMVLDTYTADVRGCHKCTGGYKGLVGVFEIVKLNKEFIDFISIDHYLEIAKRFDSFCITTFKKHGAELFADGIISFEDLHSF